MGVRVPIIRQVCRQYEAVSLGEVKKLLSSPLHECRLAAVIMLAEKYKKADMPRREAVYNLYLQALDQGYVNNWDIVDSSAEFIVGEHAWSGSHEILFELAKSGDVWHRRVAVLASFQFIKKGDPKMTLQLAKALLNDKHDLIQKAVGWMLREVGKRIDRGLLLEFLDAHAKSMPRTMLRYAIEHLPPEQRVHYMRK